MHQVTRARADIQAPAQAGALSLCAHLQREKFPRLGFKDRPVPESFPAFWAPVTAMRTSLLDLLPGPLYAALLLLSLPAVQPTYGRCSHTGHFHSLSSSLFLRFQSLLILQGPVPWSPPPGSPAQPRFQTDSPLLLCVPPASVGVWIWP